MVFDNVFPSGSVIRFLEQETGCQIAIIPFTDCSPHTSYLVSDDGRNVFVSVDFGEYSQVKAVRIIPAGSRTTNSAPAFKRRNARGCQCFAAIPASVYGAFVLRNEVPRFRLRHIDGNPNNCSVYNLTISDDSILAKNMQRLKEIYTESYDAVCRYLAGSRRISTEDAQDFASDAFIEMCYARIEIDPGKASGLWIFLASRKLTSFKSRNRILYSIYDSFADASSECEINGIDTYHYLMGLLPETCRHVVQLLLSGYNQREIGLKLGCCQAKVSQLLSQAKNYLKRHDSK